MEEYKIRCGKCRSEYNPQPSLREPNTIDASCPVCGYGKFKEVSQDLINSGKKILGD